MPTVYVQIPGAPNTTAPSPVPIPGLGLDIPAGAGEQAVIILNVPQAFAEGANFPGGWFGLSVDGAMLHLSVRFRGLADSPKSRYYTPCTLVAAVPLKLKAQKVQAMWNAETGSTVGLGASSLTVMVD
ncbi:MAG: hypothetical protein QOG38_3605 [Hyphomicrobiales bacterium]|nr:hypothetical protein [Hyphomicrobiales bacterium]